MKEQLHQLLDLANVSGVYIIDDALGADESVSYEHFIAMIRKVQANEEGLATLETLGDDLNFEENEGILVEYSTEVWKVATADKRLYYLRKLSDLTPPDEDLKTSLSIDHVLKQLSEEEDLGRAELVSMSPTDWDARSAEIISNIPDDKKLILLFDQKLERAGGRFLVTRGIDLVREMLNALKGSQLLPGILTYTVENEGLELQERVKLASESGIEDPGDLFVLTKKRLEKLPHFVDGLKKMLLNGPCELVKKKAIEVGQAAFEETKRKLLSLDTYDFNATVLQSSLKEGIWAPETLFRIIDIIYKDEVREYLLQANLVPQLNELLDTASEISRIDIPVENTELYTEKYTLRRQEIYAIGNHINGLFKPIENGDIFEVTSGTGLGFYILLAQSCDLVVRSDGTRAIEVAHLLKIKVLTQDELEEDINKMFQKARLQKLQEFNYWHTKGVIEHLEEDPRKVGLINFPRAHVINLNVLDLIMFNPNGLATIDLTGVAPKALHMGLAKRSDELHKSYVKLQKKIQQCREAMVKVEGPWLNLIIQDMPPKLSLNGKLSKVEFAGTNFTYSIRRIKSLREPYAKNILDKYTQFLSRTGNLHDFSY